MKLIPLTQGKFAKVDDEDFDFLVQMGTWLHVKGYVVLSQSGNRYMHHIIKPIQAHLFTDHVDGDGLNNQKVNLREATKSQNAMNTKTRNDNVLGVRGVCFEPSRNKYRVQLKGKLVGRFDTVEQAAAARLKAAQEQDGEFVRV